MSMGQIPIVTVTDSSPAPAPAPPPQPMLNLKVDPENQGQLRKILADITHLRRIMADYNHRIGQVLKRHQEYELMP